MSQEITTNNSPLFKKISPNLILSGVTGLLILIVLFQSFQLQQLKGYAQGFLQGQEVKAATTITPTAAPVRPTNSGRLPTQVGGC